MNSTEVEGGAKPSLISRLKNYLRRRESKRRSWFTDTNTCFIIMYIFIINGGPHFSVMNSF